MVRKSSQEAKQTTLQKVLYLIKVAQRRPLQKEEGKGNHSHKKEGTCPLKGRGCIPVNYTYGPIPSTEATVVQSTTVKNRDYLLPYTLSTAAEVAKAAALSRPPSYKIQT